VRAAAAADVRPSAREITELARRTGLSRSLVRACLTLDARDTRAAKR
jgi:hypothetical protein